MPMNDFTGRLRNRTIDDSGVRLDGNLWGLPKITGTGVSPEVAAKLAAPLKRFVDSLPYKLDEHGRIDYRANTVALSHGAKLRYAAGHPRAGETIEALYHDGAESQQHGGAPMPFIDMDTMSPHALEGLLGMLNAIIVNISSAE